MTGDPRKLESRVRAGPGCVLARWAALVALLTLLTSVSRADIAPPGPPPPLAHSPTPRSPWPAQVREVHGIGPLSEGALHLREERVDLYFFRQLTFVVIEHDLFGAPNSSHVLGVGSGSSRCPLVEVGHELVPVYVAHRLSPDDPNPFFARRSYEWRVTLDGSGRVTNTVFLVVPYPDAPRPHPLEVRFRRSEGYASRGRTVMTARAVGWTRPRLRMRLR